LTVVDTMRTVANHQPNPCLLLRLGPRMFPLSRTIVNFGTLQRKLNIAVYCTVHEAYSIGIPTKVPSFKSEIVSTGLTTKNYEISLLFGLKLLATTVDVN